MATEKQMTKKGRTSVVSRMTKEEINLLPLKKYQGQVTLLREKVLPKHIIQQLATTEVLGFDIEIRPAFRKGQSFPPSLLQLATESSVFLFQLQCTGLPEPLQTILENPKIKKVGVSVAFDIQKLKEISGFMPGGFIDLADMAKEIGINNFGLRGLTAVLLGYRIPKGAQRTNWAKKDLSKAQIQYAANDAWVGREVYLALLKRTATEHQV